MQLSLIKMSDSQLPKTNGSFFLEKKAYSDLSISVLEKNISWRNDQITIFGKTHPQPRKTAWYSDENVSYSYSGIYLPPTKWPRIISDIRDDVSKRASKHLDDDIYFNSVLINYYRNGDDYMSWHSDDEKELGKNPAIVSVSLGGGRDFQLRMKKDITTKYTVCLEHGDFFLMAGKSQHYWNHQIPKRKRQNEARMSLTFRKIIL